MPALPMVAIFGPTGVGKTDVARALVTRLRAQGEDPRTVAADALQLYAGLSVLTGAHAEDRLSGIVPLTETFSAGRYARLAHAEIDALIAEGRRPVVVGGTGLYLRAALADLDLRPPPDPAVRAALSERLEREGAARLHSELPADVAARIAPGDGIRITRALELIAAGHPPPSGDQLWTANASTGGSTRASTRWSPPGPPMKSAARTQPARARPPAGRSASTTCCATTSRA